MTDNAPASDQLLPADEPTLIGEARLTVETVLALADVFRRLPLDGAARVVAARRASLRERECTPDVMAKLNALAVATSALSAARTLADCTRDPLATALTDGDLGASLDPESIPDDWR